MPASPSPPSRHGHWRPGPACLGAVLAGVLADASAGITASVSLTSDYVWRGFSRSGGDAAVQGQVEWQHAGGAYLGTFLSSLDFAGAYGSAYRRYGSSDAADLEVVPYVGFGHALTADWRLEAQLSQYVFDDELLGTSASYQEIYLFAHYRDLLSAELALAPDAYDQDAGTLNLQATARYPLARGWTVSAGGGWFEASRVLGADYLHWHAGLTWRHRHGGIDLRYFGAADRDRTGGRPQPANGEVVMTVSFGF
ncbi:MAG: TorF family putative porin [Gammaproteobacteria bacterium]